MMTLLTTNDRQRDEQLAVRPRETDNEHLSGRVERLSSAADAERQWWLGATDAGRYGLKFAAVAVPLLRRQWAEAAAAYGSLLIAHRVCSIAKHRTSEVRPDGSDDKSFPSSHGLEAFSAATSLTVSSGLSLGVPAYAAAALVAHGRLRADRHHLQDVVVGGIAGIVSAVLGAVLSGAATRRLSAAAA